MPKYVDGTQLYEAALKRIAELEAESACLIDEHGKAIDEFDEMLEKVEAERDQLAASLEEIKAQWREHLDNCVPLSNYREITRLWEQSEASLETARKALENVWKAYTVVVSANGGGSWERHVKPAIFEAKKTLAQIAKQAAAQDYCETDDVAETLRKEDALEERNRAIAKREAINQIAKDAVENGTYDEFGLEK